MRRILEDTKPEAIYFNEQNSQRGTILIIDVADSSAVPSFAEPWFLACKPDVEIRVAIMTGDLQKAELEELGESGLNQWESYSSHDQGWV